MSTMPESWKRGMTKPKPSRMVVVIAHATEQRRYISQLREQDCDTCGDYLPGQMHFHHLRDKIFSIARLAKTVSWQELKAEIDKCVLLCVPCHQEAHKQTATVTYAVSSP